MGNISIVEKKRSEYNLKLRESTGISDFLVLGTGSLTYRVEQLNKGTYTKEGAHIPAIRQVVAGLPTAEGLELVARVFKNVLGNSGKDLFLSSLGRGGMNAEQLLEAGKVYDRASDEDVLKVAVDLQAAGLDREALSGPHDYVGDGIRQDAIEQMMGDKWGCADELLFSEALELDRTFCGDVGFNEISGEFTADGSVNKFADLADALMTSFKQKFFIRVETKREVRWTSPSIHPATVARLLKQKALRNKYNPASEYFDGLKGRWDGKDRIPSLLSWLKVENCDLNREMVSKWMLAAVHRGMMDASDPRNAVKFDQLLVLQGEGGSRKSTAVEKLAPVGTFKRAQLDCESNDAKTIVNSALIIEDSELKFSRKSDVNALKSFISEQVDVWVPKYENDPRTVNRRGIIVATTNESQILQQTEGGQRRYWILQSTGTETNPIDVASIIKFRDHLWAQAVATFWEGKDCPLCRDEACDKHGLFIPRSLVAAQQARAAEFEVRDEALTNRLTLLTQMVVDSGSHKEGMSSSEAYCLAYRDVGMDSITLKLKSEEAKTTTNVGRALAKLGWSKVKKSHGNVWCPPTKKEN